MKQRLKILRILKEVKGKINKNKQLIKDIHNFERNIEPLLCKSCKVKLRRVKGNNILSITAKGRYFCKACNEIIATKAAEVFTKI